MHATCLITPSGPLLRVTVAVSQARHQALTAAGQPIPPPVSANILVDTGASCTNLDSALIASLGLQPTGSMAVHTPSTGSTPVKQQVFDVALVVHGQLPSGPPGVHVIPNLPVLESNFAAQGIDGLLGRDVLRQCRMTYSGADGVVFLSF